MIIRFFRLFKDTMIFVVTHMCSVGMVVESVRAAQFSTEIISLACVLPT